MPLNQEVEHGDLNIKTATVMYDSSMRILKIGTFDINVENKRDVIEYDIVDEIDINGWDIRKALKLYWKSNLTFVEWLKSPIVYIDDGKFAKKSRALLDSIYSIEKGIYHYRSMAKANYRGCFKQEQARLKKYFYVLRPLLAIKWLETYSEKPVGRGIHLDALNQIFKETLR